MYRRLLPLLVFIPAALGWGCSDSTRATTAEQRDLGEEVLRAGLEFHLSPGTVENHDQDSVTARASVPLVDLSLSSGPEGAGGVEVALENVHRHARLVPTRITPLGGAEMLDCPEEIEREPIDCRIDDAPPDCEPPEVERGEETRSTMRITVDVGACERAAFRLELDEEASNESLSFAAVGRAASRDRLERALRAATEDDPDFVVLLGDNAQNSSLNGLRELELVREHADYPAIIAPGEAELVDGSRAEFLELFGPFDLRWELKGVQHVAFYSADGQLGENGVTRLEQAVGRVDNAHALLTFTHTPPVDPLGPRDDGFQSEIEGARTLSALTEHGVDALFAGHVNDAATEEYQDLTMYLTSLERVGEYLWVEVDDDRIDVERRSVR